MYLKSLELFGFKSFPDRTVLNFDSGATVVVGPNGSGKSNISDAMRWVLGEISSKNIRGTKMEDVIFGGTDGRKQMNFAEVSVTFDNSDRQMQIDFDEVTVTRRYFRKGESEYFINRKAVRLRDIHELFMNTGVGREGYSIIGQGRIAEIISRKSEDRRVIFEEAAGISKYRFKKEEAQKKLTSVDDNLSRLNDIMSELEARVGPLERESEKARKYLEYYEIKKRDDVALWIYDTEKLNTELEQAKDKLTLSKNELDIAEEELQSLENRNERIFEASQESKYKYERLQGEIDSASKDSHELDSKIKLCENDISHREIQIGERLAAKDKLISKKASLEIFVEEKKASLAQAKQKVEDTQASLTDVEKERESTVNSRNELAEQLETALGEQRECENKAVEIKLQLSVLDTTEKNDSEKSDSLKAELEKYSASREMLASRVKKAEDAISGYNAKSEEFTKKLSVITESIKKLQSEKQELIDKSNTAYLDYSAKKHRIDAIKRMEELFEGYSQSVRFVMSEYEAGKIPGVNRISDGKDSGRIWGPVSRLVNVPSKYTLAVETALGANVQNIVVDDEGAAKSAIMYLKNRNAGRATFYPISSMKPRFPSVNENECKKYAGYIGTADSVIEYDSRFDGIIRNILGATLLFDSIDNASKMAKATGYKVKIVTLDGQVINAGGSFTGGSAKRDSGMLTRRTEVEKLKTEVEALAKSLEAMKNGQNDCDGKIIELNKQYNTVNAQIQMVQSLINAESTQLEVMKNQLDGENKLSDSLRADLDKITAGSTERTDGIAKLKNDCEELEKQISEIAAKREKDAEALGELDIKAEELEGRHSELLLAHTEAGKDVEIARYELDGAQERLRETLSDIEENDNARDELANANSQNKTELEKMRESLAGLDESLKTLEVQRSQTSAENIEFEKKLNNLRIQMRDKSNKKELCFRDFTLAENKVNNLSAEREKMTARLWDDYELTYSSAIECAYPPVTEENRKAVSDEFTEYRNKLRALGNVNLASIDEYTEVKQRYDFMTVQITDLKDSKENLLDIIVKLEAEMREAFVSAFEEIDRNFKIVFSELFGGGTAELVLTDPEDVLTSGIEIRVAPPGKIIKSLMLLSGGEQAFVAIALIFAIIRVNPTPFCIFDEIEAALDEANVFRFADYLKRYSKSTQFIVITHRRGTMEIADRIYGVTMQERGISKILSLDINQASNAIADSETN